MLAKKTSFCPLVFLTFRDFCDILNKKFRAQLFRVQRKEKNMWHFVGKFNRLSRCIAAYRARKVPESELLPHHHSLVFFICKEEGRSQEALAKALFLNKSTVARTLTYLEEKGYVLRRSSEADKRITLVYPTGKRLILYTKREEEESLLAQQQPSQ